MGGKGALILRNQPSFPLPITTGASPIEGVVRLGVSGDLTSMLPFPGFPWASHCTQAD